MIPEQPITEHLGGAEELSGEHTPITDAVFTGPFRPPTRVPSKTATSLSMPREFSPLLPEPALGGEENTDGGFEDEPTALAELPIVDTDDDTTVGLSPIPSYSLIPNNASEAASFFSGEKTSPALPRNIRYAAVATLQQEGAAAPAAKAQTAPSGAMKEPHPLALTPKKPDKGRMVTRMIAFFVALGAGGLIMLVIALGSTASRPETPQIREAPASGFVAGDDERLLYPRMIEELRSEVASLRQEIEVLRAAVKRAEATPRGERAKR